MNDYEAYLIEYIGEDAGLASGIGKLLPGSSLRAKGLDIKGMLKDTIRELLSEEVTNRSTRDIKNSVRFEDRSVNDYFF